MRTPARTRAVRPGRGVTPKAGAQQAPPRRDPRIDAYIARSAPFARPILEHLRAVVHAACPEVSETIKWGMPAFEYKGPLAAMAAFKAHATFGFWKGTLILDDPGRRDGEAMGQFGRIASLADLPSKRALTGYLKKAMALNDAGTKVDRRSATPRRAIPMPKDFAAALARSTRARTAFDGMPPSHRREYLEWIVEAKRDETRRRRIATAVAWLTEGKSLRWRYERT
jgi:uncharacterized protein YdeI (YjbR/CyaY-like superfamily)